MSQPSSSSGSEYFDAVEDEHVPEIGKAEMKRNPIIITDDTSTTSMENNVSNLSRLPSLSSDSNSMVSLDTGMSSVVELPVEFHGNALLSFFSSSTCSR